MKRLFLAGLVCLAGCVPPPTQTAPLVETIAILPFDNESNDLNAPDIMQQLVSMALQNSPYRISDIQAVNDKLASVGIVDGGQLPAVDPVKLGKDLGVQALLYGNVESFNYTNIGFYMQRKVNLELKLVDVATGNTLWENNGSHAARQVHLDKNEAGRAFAKGLAEQTVEKLFNSPLEEEAKLATIQALRKLPGFQFSGFHEGGRLKGAKNSNIKNAIRTGIKNK
jgi:hypothetical protein